jgi:hypothetical protein
MTKSRDEMIDILWAEREIRQVVQNYCRGVDRCKINLLESVFHEDAIDEHGFNPTNTAREYLDAVPVRRPHIEEIQHHTTNHVIQIDGDRAEGEVYVIAYHRYQEEGAFIILAVGGRYLDKYECRDKVWRIAHRVCVEDWSIKMPAPQQRKDELTGTLPHGGLGEADPSYRFFQSLT